MAQRGEPGLEAGGQAGRREGHIYVYVLKSWEGGLRQGCAASGAVWETPQTPPCGFCPPLAPTRCTCLRMQSGRPLHHVISASSGAPALRRWQGHDVVCLEMRPSSMQHTRTHARACVQRMRAAKTGALMHACRRCECACPRDTSITQRTLHACSTLASRAHGFCSAKSTRAAERPTLRGCRLDKTTLAATCAMYTCMQLASVYAMNQTLALYTALPGTGSRCNDHDAAAHAASSTRTTGPARAHMPQCCRQRMHDARTQLRKKCETFFLHCAQAT